MIYHILQDYLRLYFCVICVVKSYKSTLWVEM
nr:MAG TPA: hypothetical protein [Bacteriophage sp.]